MISRMSLSYAISLVIMTWNGEEGAFVTKIYLFIYSKLSYMVTSCERLAPLYPIVITSSRDIWRLKSLNRQLTNWKILFFMKSQQYHR